MSFRLVSDSGCLGPHESPLVSHTCLPLWVLRAMYARKDAEMVPVPHVVEFFYICLGSTLVYFFFSAEVVSIVFPPGGA